MKRIHLTCMLAGGVIATAAAAGCARQKSRSISVEGPEKKYELELTSTEKDPKNEDD